MKLYYSKLMSVFSGYVEIFFAQRWLNLPLEKLARTLTPGMTWFTLQTLGVDWVLATAKATLF